MPKEVGLPKRLAILQRNQVAGIRSDDLRASQKSAGFYLSIHSLTGTKV